MPDEKPKRTTDDRIDAIVQTVELLAAMHTGNERRMAQMMEAINRLANIAAIHEQRISNLEGEGRPPL